MSNSNRLGDWFERRENERGTWWAMKDSCPEWLSIAVRDAHGDILPSDWVFEVCARFCGYIDDVDRSNKDPDEIVNEFADSMVDVYTQDLAQWYRDMCLSSLFDEARQLAGEFATDKRESIEDELSRIQYFASRTIAERLLVKIMENEGRDD